MEQIVNAILDDLIQPTGGSQASGYIAKLAATGELKRGKVTNPSTHLKQLAREQSAARKEKRKRDKLRGSGMDISEIFKG